MGSGPVPYRMVPREENRVVVVDNDAPERCWHISGDGGEQLLSEDLLERAARIGVVAKHRVKINVGQADKARAFDITACYLDAECRVGKNDMFESAENGGPIEIDIANSRSVSGRCHDAAIETTVAARDVKAFEETF
jgi:hypothetical protein